MKVSIVIPVYNEQDFIEKSIESIINQTTKPQKVISLVNQNLKTPKE